MVADENAHVLPETSLSISGLASLTMPTGGVATGNNRCKPVIEHIETHAHSFFLAARGSFHLLILGQTASVTSTEVGQQAHNF